MAWPFAPKPSGRRAVVVNILIKRLAVLLFALTATSLAPAVWAENFTTNIITTTSNAVLSVDGNTGKLNYLEVRSGGVLNATNSVIGFAATASTNSATVTGSGSRWNTFDNLYVGLTGSVSRLTVISAGSVSNDAAFVGYDAASRENMVLVTGANSRWRSESLLVIGQAGAGNNLTISNTAVASCGFDSLIGGDVSGSNNTVFVTGTGSAWNSTNGMYVGYAGCSNRLTIASGGVVSNDFGVIGSFSSTGNVVTVTGANSAWRMSSGDLTIGDSESVQNQLIITNGGAVASLTGRFADADTSAGNLALVTGAGSQWVLGDSLYVGDVGSSNQLGIHSGGLITNLDAFVGFEASSISNTVTVSGTGSFWKNRDLTVGDDGTGNLLIVQTSGVVSSRFSYVGSGISSSSNTIWVTGSGSRFVTSQNCIVGDSGCDGLLVISAGGQVISGNTYVGGQVDSCNNTLLVTDSSSVVSNVSAMEVGFDGTSNRLIVTNGAKVVCSFGRVSTYGFMTQATITGTNSFWIDSGDFYVGQVGAGTRLNIENGAVISNQIGYAGIYNYDTAVTVTGPGSRWNNRGDLYVNYGGIHERLVISNGGIVSNATGYVGYLDAASDTDVQVTGSGSLWMNAGDLFVGFAGTSNKLTIASGATVRATNLVAGAFASATNNLISVASGNLIVTNGAGTAKINVQIGNLDLNDGTVRTGTMILSSNAVLSGMGTISANVVTNGGVVSPGNLAGRITINGNLRLQSTSALRFDLGGYNPATTHDVITVTNGTTFAGTLSVGFIFGFQGIVTNGASFTVLTANSIAGSFANAANGATITSADGFATFRVNYPGTSLFLNQTQITDSVGDGIPNWWRAQYFGGNGATTNSQSCASCDSDGDGRSNALEYPAGTDPTKYNSVLQITAVAQESNNLRITWTTVTGKKYVLQTSTDIVSAPFVDLSPIINAPVGGESVTNYVHAGGVTGAFQRFYRVRLVP